MNVVSLVNVLLTSISELRDQLQGKRKYTGKTTIKVGGTSSYSGPVNRTLVLGSRIWISY